MFPVWWSPARLRIAIALAALAAAMLLAGEVRAHAAGRTIRSTGLEVPALGAIQTVDENDVGDPFILTVPPGTDPPGGLPYSNSGPDAYVSSPWTATDTANAKEHGWYVLLGTTDWQSNIPTAISTDRLHWTQAPDSLPVLPSWAEPNISTTWAPAGLHLGSRWILYFSTEEARSHLECIGRAVSSNPAGPYTDDSDQPMLCQRPVGGSIDPSIVRSSGSTYLVFKNDGNAAGQPDYLWSQELSADGLSLRGSPHRLLAAAKPWTQGIVEAPAMVPSSGGGFWLFYSGGGWDSNRYATGVAHCTTVSGPCTDPKDHPYLGSSADLVSPGGLDTFLGHDGRLYAAFTALVLVPSTWHPGRYYYNRVLDIAPILTR
jgi:beta-xylosidase